MKRGGEANRRLPNPKYVEPDPLTAPGDSDLRLRRGAMAADALLQRGYRAQEAMSRLALQLSGLEQEFSGIEGKEWDFLKAVRVPSRLLGEWLAAVLALSLLALGELAALTLVMCHPPATQQESLDCMSNASRDRSHDNSG